MSENGHANHQEERQLEENHQSVTKDFPDVVQGEDSQMRDHSVERGQVEEI